MAFKFTYDNYSKLLFEMKKISNIFAFCQLNSEIKNGFILRHDVDFDLLHAYRMSLIEADAKVMSTFFVLTTSDQYNINTKNNRTLLKSIAENSEIGLHFDPTVYKYETIEELTKFVYNEVSIIENIVGNKVSAISLHNPSIHNEYPIFNDFMNAYSQEYFCSELYISDSSKDFRGKNIFEFIQKGSESIVQVLIHPIHYSVTESPYSDAFAELYKVSIDNLDLLMKLNRKYREEMSDIRLFDYIMQRGVKHD